MPAFQLIAELDGFPDFIHFGDIAKMLGKLPTSSITNELRNMNPAYASVNWDGVQHMKRPALVLAIDTLQFFQVNVCDIPHDTLYHIADHVEFVSAVDELVGRWEGAESPTIRALKCVRERTANTFWIAAKTGLYPYLSVAIRDDLEVHPDSARIAARFGHIDCVRLALIAGNSADGIFLGAARGDSPAMIQFLDRAYECTVCDKNAILAAAISNGVERTHMVDAILDVVSFDGDECTVPNVAKFCVENGTVKMLEKAIRHRVLLNNPTGIMAAAIDTGPHMVAAVVDIFKYDQCAVPDVCLTVATSCRASAFHRAVAQGYPIGDSDRIVCAAARNGECMLSAVLAYLPRATNVAVRAAEVRDFNVFMAAIDRGHVIDSDSSARIIFSHAINTSRAMTMYVIRVCPFIRDHACLMIAVLCDEKVGAEYMQIAIALGCAVPAAAYVSSKTQKIADIVANYVELTDNDHFKAAVNSAYNNRSRHIVRMSAKTTNRGPAVCTAAVMGGNPMAFAFARKCGFIFDAKEMQAMVRIMADKYPEKYTASTLKLFADMIELGPIVAVP